MTPTTASLTDVPVHRLPYTTGWLWVLCVIGLDYLSSLAYVPSVAFAVAGPLAPLVVGVVVAVTLFLAVPLFCYTAGRSPHGHGTIGLLERVVPGWRGKLFVVILLGFIATDLVFTRTYSAADAAEHLIHSPYSPWQQTLDGLASATDSAKSGLPEDVSSLAGKGNTRQLVVTFGLLFIGSTFGWLFRKGIDRRLVWIAVAAVGLYLILSAVIVGCGISYLANHTDLVTNWWQGVEKGDVEAESAAGGNDRADAPARRGRSLPARCTRIERLRTDAGGDAAHPRQGRRRPRPPGESDSSGEVDARRFGPVDVRHAAALGPRRHDSDSGAGPDDRWTGGQPGTRVPGPWRHVKRRHFAHRRLPGVRVRTRRGVRLRHGRRVDAGWCDGAHRYAGDDPAVPAPARHGMDVVAPARAAHVPVHGRQTRRDLLLQGGRGRSARGVPDRRARALHRRQPDGRGGRLAASGDCRLATAASRFHPVYHCLDCFRIEPRCRGREAPGGGPHGRLLRRAAPGHVDRHAILRTRELRFDGFDFADADTEATWDDLTNNNFPMLVPIRPGGESLAVKEREIRTVHRLPHNLLIVFIEAELGDPSDFAHRPLISIVREEGRVVVRIARCTSLPHAIAAAALDIAKEGPVPEVHFGWSAENPLTANINFVLFGQGNIPWMVHELIRRADVPDERRPRVVVG